MSVTCTCKRYECYGLLCCHIFLVFKMFNVTSFPKKYVLRRWSREALPPKTVDTNQKLQEAVEKANGADAVIREIFYSVEYCVNRLVGDMDKLRFFRDHEKDLMMKADFDVPSPTQINKTSRMGSMLGVTVPKNIDINVPTGIRNKGSDVRTRLKSKKEIAMDAAAKKFRLCGSCNKREGHNIKTCPYKNGASTSGS